MQRLKTCYQGQVLLHISRLLQYADKMPTMAPNLHSIFFSNLNRKCTSFSTIVQEIGDCQGTMQGLLPIFKPGSMARGMEYTHWLDLGHGLAWGAVLGDNRGTVNRKRTNGYWTNRNKCSLEWGYKNRLVINRKWFVVLSGTMFENQSKLNDNNDLVVI